MSTQQWKKKKKKRLVVTRLRGGWVVMGGGEGDQIRLPLAIATFALSLVTPSSSNILIKIWKKITWFNLNLCCWKGYILFCAFQRNKIDQPIISSFFPSKLDWLIFLPLGAWHQRRNPAFLDPLSLFFFRSRWPPQSQGFKDLVKRQIHLFKIISRWTHTHTTDCIFIHTLVTKI